MIRIAVVVEISYLLLVNVALQVPATQSLINTIKPEKFQVSWVNAWSWYPFRVNASGVFANGQSRSQQWQLETASAAASIAVLPLLFKRVWIDDVVAQNVSYRQRPRLRPDKDYTDLLPFYPEIDGRDINSIATAPRKKKRPWHLSIDNISVSGNHHYWLMQFKGSMAGKFSADLAFATGGGPFSLARGQLDLTLDTLYANSNTEVFNRGIVRGELELAPFVPRENKGIKALRFVTADADISMDVNSLAFINLFTRNFNQMTIDGAGRIDGHLQLQQGHILAGTDLSVDADDLLLNILGHHIQGEGTLNLAAGDGSDELATLNIQYADLEVTHIGDASALLKGDQLKLTMTGPGFLFATPNEPHELRNMHIAVASLAVPNLALLEHYLPEKWPLKIYGGEGLLHANANISTNALDLNIALSSNNANLGVGEYRFQTDLDAALKLVNPSVSSSDTSIAGSYIRLTEAGFSRKSQEDVERWNASLEIKDGHLGMLPPAKKQQTVNMTGLLSLLSQPDGKKLLSTVHGSVNFASSVSSLEWLNVLLKDNYDIGISGHGEINGLINLEDAQTAPGTDLLIKSDKLALDILDYRSSGSGEITLRVQEGDIGPDWWTEIMLHEADLMRKSDSTPYIQNVNLSVAASIENVNREKAKQDSTLTFRILSANVTDLSIFNSYLPPGTPLQLTSGTASLTADIVLRADEAHGWLSLESHDMAFTIDDQSVRSDFAANIIVMDGVPADMQFDISGSELRLDDVHVVGKKQDFSDDRWSASLQMVQGKTLWKKPLQLDAEATIQILDSRPLVAMFNNKRGSPDWLQDMLTIRNIEGRTKIAIANETIVIPLAHVTADKIEVGAKGRINKQSRDGVFYARYKKLDAILKVNSGKKNIDVLNAREKYDIYQARP
ncbi:MAG: hypothetical protein V7700_11380 [Halioglobus sp.]